MKVHNYSVGTSLGSLSHIPEPSYTSESRVSTNTSLIAGQLIYKEGDNTSKYQLAYLSPDFFFSDTPHLKLKEYYAIQEAEFSRVIRFVSKHQLGDFLLWIHDPIINVFGNIKKTLNLFKCWDDEDDHLVLTICSSLDDMDEMMALEEKLFDTLKNYYALDSTLHHIVIAQD